MTFLRSLWHKSKLYKSFQNFVEAKTENVIRKVEARIKADVLYDIWDSLPDFKIEKFSKKIDNNIKLNFYLDSHLSKLIFGGDFEKDEITFLKKYLRKGDVFIDVGANIGLFSLIASSVIGETGRVISFEPTSKTFNRFLENIQINHFSNIEAHQVAISNTIGEAKLNIASDGFDAWNSLGIPSAGKVIENETVKTYTLDSFFKTKKEIEKISLIKIDVEGWEIPVIEGAVKLCSKLDAPNLIVEFTDSNAINCGYSCTDLYNLLVEYGYKLYTYDDASNNLVNEEIRESYPCINIIATKKSGFILNRLNAL